MIYWVLLFVVGLSVGSFLNVCIIRIPAGKSILTPASHCQTCGHQLAVWENIPLISFFLLHRQCRNCSTAISWQYPAVEFISGIVALLGYWKFSLTLEYFFYMFFFYILIIIAVIDWKYQIIPRVISYPALVAGIIGSIFLYNWYSGLLGAITGACVIFCIRIIGNIAFRKESMGIGDITLSAVIGAFVGWKINLLAIGIAFVLAFVFSLVLLILQRASMKHSIPFGTFLAIGSILAVLEGDFLIECYVSGFVF